MEKTDLLKKGGSEGCSAKLPAKDLQEALKNFSIKGHPNLLVDVSSHDDGGVYKINENQAIIQTTDFFPPVCSNPYEFGQIAASNALSDVFAMGGTVLTALNIVLFPFDLPLSVLPEILKGGQDKVLECGGVVAGGHTITDDSLKYGMAVTGLVHPDRIITNSAAKPGDVLIITKPIGTGVQLAAKRLGMANENSYQLALENMKTLNQKAAIVMQKHNVKCATDVTGFGLAGHLLKMAKASNVIIEIDMDKVPVIGNTISLLQEGCIPGAAFRNLDFTEADMQFSEFLTYEQKMLAMDAQTSGGIVMSVDQNSANSILKELKAFYPETAIIGEVFSAKKESGLKLNNKKK
ncbi:MAG: selenide, water dikinase SelD [Bacteroidales bacterium]|nr:selenide, water dikinase SelD [Bacteroidales bacterium]